MKIVPLIVIGIVFILNSASIGIACTGFTASDENKVLVGSNEDSFNTRRYVEIYTPTEGTFGKIFFCYERAYCQQAMNDQGLFYDGFWAPHLDIQDGEGKPAPPDGWMIDDWMNTCSTVDEVIVSYENYDWRDSGIEDAMLFFVDRQGNSAIIEGDEIVYKAGNYQVVTNFYQTHPELGGFGFDRYETAIDMLENIDDFSMEYFRSICDATHQLGSYPTIYSLVCDLTRNVIHYYYHHNYDNFWEINLDELFEYGNQTYDVLDVFNNHEPDKPNSPIGTNNCDEYSTHDYSCQGTDIDGDQLYYKWDFGDGTISNWIGPFNSGEICTQSHQWTDVGKYQVRVMTRDENCGKSEWSDPLEVQVKDSDNNRPDKPLTPSGPPNGKTGEEHTYTTSTTDLDGDQLYYMWDWGDGTFSDWIGPYDSGKECSISNIWSSKGNYEVKVKARDTSHLESDWSDPLSISMPKSKAYNNRPILTFLSLVFPMVHLFQVQISFFI